MHRQALLNVLRRKVTIVVLVLLALVIAASLITGAHTASALIWSAIDVALIGASLLFAYRLELDDLRYAAEVKARRNEIEANYRPIDA